MARGGLEPTEELLEYLARWGARKDDVLDRVRAETAERPDSGMQIAADQGALMELVVRLIGAKNALEVGTFTGYSAICIARGLADGESLETIPAETAFDFAFIDADKPGYPVYYELVLERMRPGGLVLLDNMLMGGRIVAPDRESTRTIDQLNRRIHGDDRVDMAMTMAADGLTFVRVR